MAFSFNTVLESLATAVTQGWACKCSQIRKDKFKPSLFADDMIVYRKNPKESTEGKKKTVRINEWISLQETKPEIHDIKKNKITGN